MEGFCEFLKDNMWKSNVRKRSYLVPNPILGDVLSWLKLEAEGGVLFWAVTEDASGLGAGLWMARVEFGGAA